MFVRRIDGELVVCCKYFSSLAVLGKRSPKKRVNGLGPNALVRTGAWVKNQGNNPSFHMGDASISLPRRFIGKRFRLVLKEIKPNSKIIEKNWALQTLEGNDGTRRNR